MPSKTITRKEYDDLKALQEKSGVEVGSLMPEEMSPTCTVAALGGAYALGNLDLLPATLETFALLSAIRSPFVVGVEDDGEDPTSIQCIAKTVLVLASPPDAIRPIMALAQRRKAVESTKEIAEKSPEFYDVYLRKLDDLSTMEAAFEAEAVAVYSQAGAVSIDEAITVIRQAMSDAMDGFTLLPETDAKKKNPEGSTWKTLARWLLPVRPAST